MITIPQKETKSFSQPNVGDTQGNLWGTFCVDLTKNLGRVRATRCQTVFSEEDDADFGTPVAFAYFDILSAGDPVFIAYADRIFIGGSDPISTSWAQDAATNSPNDSGYDGDMTVFNNKLYATEPTKLKRLNPAGGTWADITTLTSGNSHQLCGYKDKLYFVDQGLKVFSMNLNETVNTSGNFTLDLSYLAGHISWIKAGSNRIWIGVTKKDGTKGLIFEWDGQSDNLWSKNYIIEAQGSAGCAVWNDIPYVLDIEGRLLAYTGSNFDEVARLPILLYDVVNNTYASASAFKICHFNGIQYINDAIHIAVNNEVVGTSEVGTEENYPSGIYEYTKENGLTHKFSPSLTVINTATVDYGQHIVNDMGAIFDATVRRSNANNNFSSIMFGVELEGADGTNINAVNIDVIQDRINDPDHKRLAYVISPFIESQRVTDTWQAIVIKYRKFLDNADTITVKYRTKKDEPIVYQNVPWDSDTAFTVTGNPTNISVGDEIEVLNGNGGGAIAHITNIVDNGSTFTVTLDQSIVGVSALDISDIRFQTWKKLQTITADSFQYKNLPIPQLNNDTEIQFKVVLNWVNKENELREILIVNSTDQYAK